MIEIFVINGAILIIGFCIGLAYGVHDESVETRFRAENTYKDEAAKVPDFGYNLSRIDQQVVRQEATLLKVTELVKLLYDHLGVERVEEFKATPRGQKHKVYLGKITKK